MRLLVAVFLFIAFATLFYLPAGADENEDAVEILVTPKIISISIDEGQLDYGSPEIGTIDNRPGPPDFTVTNNSTVGVDLQINGSNTESVVDQSPGWTLAGTAGPDEYVHRFSTASHPQYPAEFSVLTTTPANFFSGVAVLGTIDITLSLDMPTSTTTLDQQSADVTVIALEDS